MSQDIENLIIEHQRRLRIRQEQLARMGPNTPPEIVMEIEDIEKEIKQLLAEKARRDSREDDVRGCFIPPELAQQGLARCLGWGRIRRIIAFKDNKAVVIARGGAGLFNLDTGRLLWRVDCPAQCGAISPDGKLLAIGSETVIYLWNMGDGQFRPTLARGRGTTKGRRVTFSGPLELETIPQYGGIVTSIAFSPRGDTLASGLDDNTVCLWRISDGAHLQTLQGHTAPVTHVAFDPQGETLATGADHTVRLWKVEGGVLQHILKHKKWLRGCKVTSLIFSTDGNSLATGADDQLVRLWQVASGQLQKTLKRHSDRITALAFNPIDGSLASASADKTVKRWRASDGGLLRTIDDHPNGIVSVAFSPDGNTLVSATNDHIYAWRDSGAPHSQPLAGCSGSVKSLAFSPDGNTIAAATANIAYLWPAAGGDPRATLEGHTAPVRRVAFSPDGKTVATGSFDQTVRLWRASNGALLYALEGHPGAVVNLAISPDGAWLAAASLNEIRLWDIATGHHFYTLREHTGQVLGVAFTPDGKTLVSGGADNMVRAWQFPEGTYQGEPAWASTPISHLALGPNENVIAFATTNQVELWRWEDKRYRHCHTLKGGKGDIMSLAFQPNGELLTTASVDGIVRLWRTVDGTLQKTIRGHTDFVWSLAFSPDGHWLTTGSQDGTIRLWRMK